MENKMIMVKKIAIIPAASDNAMWLKKFNEYVEFLRRDAEEKYKAVSEKKNLKDKDNILKNLRNKMDRADKFLADGEITKPLLNDYVFNFCRDASREEAKHKNYVISKVIDTLRIAGYEDLSSDEAKKIYKDTFNAALRTKNSTSAAFINNPLKGYGLSWGQTLNSSLKKDIFNGAISCKNGQARNFKPDSPFTVAKSMMGFSHTYDSDGEMYAHISDTNANIYFDLGAKGKPTILRFKLNLGANPKNKNELISVIKKVYSGEYEYCASSIKIEGAKILLYLCLAIPEDKEELKSENKVGVSLGLNTAVIAVTNANKKDVLKFGDEHTLEYYRVYIQNRLWKLKKELKYINGGHGRKEKLEKLNIYKDRERRFVNDFNHKASYAIIKFALKYQASVIVMPDLTGFAQRLTKEINEARKNHETYSHKYMLRNWSYYELTSMVEYKAARKGITVIYKTLSEDIDGVADIDKARMMLE